jgi:hypothetical protein
MGLIELTHAMNAKYSNRAKVQQIAQSTLRKFMCKVVAAQIVVRKALCEYHFLHRMSLLFTQTRTK